MKKEIPAQVLRQLDFSQAQMYVKVVLDNRLQDGWAPSKG